MRLTAADGDRVAVTNLLSLMVISVESIIGAYPVVRLSNTAQSRRKRWGFGELNRGIAFQPRVHVASEANGDDGSLWECGDCPLGAWRRRR